MTRSGLGQHVSTISTASLERYTFVRATFSDREDPGKGTADESAGLLPLHRVLLLQPGLHQACTTLTVQVTGFREIKDVDTRRHDIDFGLESVAHNRVYFQLLAGVWLLEERHPVNLHSRSATVSVPADQTWASSVAGQALSRVERFEHYADD